MVLIIFVPRLVSSPKFSHLKSTLAWSAYKSRLRKEPSESKASVRSTHYRFRLSDSTGSLAGDSCRDVGNFIGKNYTPRTLVTNPYSAKANDITRRPALRICTDALCGASPSFINLFMETKYIATRTSAQKNTLRSVQ